MYTREYVDKRIVEISTKVFEAYSFFRFTDIELPRRFNSIVLEIQNNTPNITLAAELRYVKRLARYFIKLSIEKSPLQDRLKKQLIIKHMSLAIARYNEIGYNDCPSFEQKYASELKPDYKIYKHLFMLTNKNEN